jgi:hypothetical protein
MSMFTITNDFGNNLILYFYSAMPQVLGTMLALLGAFYPIRASGIKHEILEYYQGAKNKINVVINIGLKRYGDTAISQVKAALHYPENERNFVDDIFVVTPPEEAFEEFLISVANSSYSGITNIGIIEADIKLIKKSYDQACRELNIRIAKHSKELNPKLIAVGNYSFDNTYLFRKEYRDLNECVALCWDKIKILNILKSNIKKVFVFNGCVLITFIIAFIFLHYTVCSSFIHYAFLIGGTCLASLSAYSMIYYVYNTVSENLQTTLFWIPWKKNIL